MTSRCRLTPRLGALERAVRSELVPGVRAPRLHRTVPAHRPLRIVLVEAALDDDGALRVSLDRAARWQAAGASVVVFVAEPGGLGSKLVVPEHLAVRHGTRAALRFRWSFLLGLARLLLLARRADVVVSGREIGLGLLQAVLVGRLVRRPVAVSVQSRADVAIQAYVGPEARGWTTKALRSVDLAVCVSAGIGPTLVDIGVAPDRLRTVTNGVDVERIRSEGRHAPEVALPAGPFVMGSGRLHRQKGFDLLLRAHARALREGAPAHHVVVVGEGPDQEALEELASDLGVADTVVFAGFVANPHAVAARADAFVLPSRWEGYPLALVEAICLATPCIAASCIAGPDEVLDGGRFGELVRSEDEAALAAALRRHLEDQQPLRARALAGAAEASVRFDPARAAGAHLDLLEELSRSSGRRRGC